MISTHYRQPLDWTVDRLVQARSTLIEWSDFLHGAPIGDSLGSEFVGALEDDLNTPAALSILYGWANAARRRSLTDVKRLKTAAQFLGVYDNEKAADIAVGYEVVDMDSREVDRRIAARNAARAAKNFKEADRIRDELETMGITLKDAKDPKTGELVTTWEVAR
jgi:cysteinyl-tRNA synthetase